MTPRDGAAEGAVDLWAMAAELERQFAGYKQRCPEKRRSASYMDDDDDAPESFNDAAHVDGEDAIIVNGDDASNGDVAAEEAQAPGDGGDGVRGRMYEAYTRRRDERLRSVWRARMERKEAEVMAIWAQLRGGGSPTAAADDVDDDDGCTAGGEEAAEDDGERRTSADVAAPGRVSGKKHPRTRRSFSSVNLSKSSRPEAGFRRAHSQEPLEPPTSESRMHGAHRARPPTVNGVAPKRKGPAKENGSLRQAGTKPPRGGLPRPCSSGGMDAVVLPNASVAASASQSRPSEQAAASDRQDEAPKASPPRPFDGISNSAAGARSASPESECGNEVLNGAEADGGEVEVKNAGLDVERRDAEEIVVQVPEAEAKLGNGEITSDSETEPSYVFIKTKDEKPTRLSDALAGSDAEAEPRLEDKNGHHGDADFKATRAADADTITTVEIATTENVESSNEMSSFSYTGRSGRGSAPSSPLSCSSRAQSIERMVEEDVALLQKKREDRGAAGGRVSTPPGSAGRMASGMARTTSPRGTGIGFKKRFLSFGKKNRGADGATVIECTSPASVPVSPADYSSQRRRCRTADDSISPRLVGRSSNADDTEHSYGSSSQACSLQSLVAASPAKSEMSEMVPQEKSPKSHRSFFSFRSFNCGRG